MTMQHYRCGECRRAFAAPLRKGRKPRYCSAACKQRAWREGRSLVFPDGYTPPIRKKPKQPKPCKHCGVITTRPQFCSVPCSTKARDIAVGVFQGEPRDCDECGERFLAKQRQSKFCSRECKRKGANRASSAIRRARVGGLSRQRFDPLAVLERDGWRCHICGVSTPKRLRGSYDERAPELDHIIPLAAGGEHSMRNTACSCRKCNIAKGDKPLGQLRLVA